MHVPEVVVGIAVVLTPASTNWFEVSVNSWHMTEVHGSVAATSYTAQVHSVCDLLVEQVHLGVVLRSQDFLGFGSEENSCIVAQGDAVYTNADKLFFFYPILRNDVELLVNAIELDFNLSVVPPFPQKYLRYLIDEFNFKHSL